MKIFTLVYQHLLPSQGNFTWNSLVWIVDSAQRKWIDPKTWWLQDKAAPWASMLCLSQSLNSGFPPPGKCWSPEPQAPSCPLQDSKGNVHTCWDIYKFTWLFHNLHCSRFFYYREWRLTQVSSNIKKVYKIGHANKENGIFPLLAKPCGKLWWGGGSGERYK